MAYNAVLLDILEHISSISEPVKLNWGFVQQWPSGALEYFVQAGVLKSASSAQSIECNACEHCCFMDVMIQPGEDGADNRAFIVCDLPEMQMQMGRIQIPLERLQQWTTGFKQLAEVIAGLLGFDGHIEYKTEQESIRLGMLKSKSGRRWVSLKSLPLVLEVNGFSVPVSELLFFDDGELAIDKLRIDGLINSKPVSKAYTPSIDKREARKLSTRDKYQDWQDEYVSLQKEHPQRSKIWFSRQIAKLPIAQGASSETIRRQLK